MALRPLIAGLFDKGSAFNAAVPGPIGGTTPAAITGTTITATTKFIAADGTSSLPAFTFANDLDCGMYRTGANQIELSVNSAMRLQIANTFVAMGAIPCYFGDGTVGAPSIGSYTNGGTGLWFSASATTMNFTTAGVNRMAMVAAGISVTVPIVLANYTVATLPSASTSGAGATAFVTDASTTFALSLGLTVLGSGSNKVPVYSDGTNWIVG